MEINEQQQKTAVQDTASDAILQKLYSIEKGYFKDNYQKLFIPHSTVTQKYLPIINKGTYTRVRAIRNQITYLIDNLVVERNQSVQIINLGCGMDSLYFVLKDTYKDKLSNKLKFVDLDYSEITKQKIKFIQASNVLSDLIPSLTVSSDKKKLISDDYTIYNCNIADKAELENAFKQSKVTKDDFTIVIAECLLCYLRTEDINSMLKTLTGYFTNSALLYYDLLHPNDDFGRVMIKNLRVYRNIILPSYEDCPTEETHIDRCVKNGYSTSNVCVDMLTYFHDIIPKEELKIVNHLELLDELEEWNLLQKHYCIGVSIQVGQGYDFLAEYKLK